jgi:hypothetical protein
VIPSEWRRCAEERGCGGAKQSSPAIAVGRASWCAAGPSVHPPCDGNRHGDVGAQGGEVGDAPVALASEEVDANVGHVANVLEGPVAVAAVRAVVAVATGSEEFAPLGKRWMLLIA